MRNGKTLAEQLRGHPLAPGEEKKILQDAADQLRNLDGSADEIRTGISEILGRIPPEALGVAGIT
jgi:hypothetical protein